jgi:hypothetical protein
LLDLVGGILSAVKNPKYNDFVSLRLIVDDMLFDADAAAARQQIVPWVPQLGMIAKER